MILVTLTIFLTWIWVAVGIDKLLIDLSFRNFFSTKLHGLGACWLLAGCLFGCIYSNGL